MNDNSVAHTDESSESNHAQNQPMISTHTLAEKGDVITGIVNRIADDLQYYPPMNQARQTNSTVVNENCFLKIYPAWQKLAP